MSDTAIKLSSLLSRLARRSEPGDAASIASRGELQVATVAATAPMLAASGAVLGAAATAVFWSQVPSHLLLPWAAVTLFFLVALPVLLRNAHRGKLSRAEVETLVFWITALSIARGLAWGAGFLLLYHYIASPAQLAILLALAVGNALGGASALMAIPQAGATFALCTVSPLAVALFASGRAESVVAGALLLVYALGIRSAAGQVLRFVTGEVALRGELVAKQSELIAAKADADHANRAKSAFLAHMSHELRTPLNAILGYSDLMRQGTFGPIAPPRYAGYLDDIHASGAHLLKLINDILDLAKIEAGKQEFTFAAVDLRQAAHEAVKLIEPQAQRAHVAVMMDFKHAAVVSADARAVTQIITNLLSNAVKFSRMGGIAVVFCEVLSDQRTVFGVKDTGIGMTPEMRAKALEPFAQGSDAYTVEGRGTGLGLPIVKGLIEAHEGRLDIESTAGLGSKIWVEFPPARLLRTAARTGEAASAA